ncbi:hypothetical protein [Vibrio europaeus]|uniref:Uncharacterized protein n=1 Tax=Vibrio europaeus TaxID=300876 RepID=A0A178J3H3_9VIBR|nr:hypothetical protein [Vibrio europaeus]MDC5708415.1 hypothetical protein [Vibrio europaeus]MDC5713147.1 hypothetical protein [Vibrio europaeus]MDC5728152.1 hypothetical protein [Vibrio europaeus]MDC5733253.1 hypothetical protein [Vibrio europaeus]MDC5742369.1 hypothetical protein [Vibrio europaeus]
MIVARPLHPSEPDLLVGYAHHDLVIKNMDGEQCLSVKAPQSGWTHDLLEQYDYDAVAKEGWDAYLGNQWIGSSEV